MTRTTRTSRKKIRSKSHGYNERVNETEYTRTAITEKRGMVVFECAEENLLDYVTRRKIQKQVAKSAYEHFIIYTNAEKTTDIYQWVKSFLKDLPNRKMNAPEKSNACSEKSLISTAVSSKNTNLRHFTAKTLTSPTRRLSSFSDSLSSTSGTSTTVPYEKRTEWNAPADPDYALPTEIWRETVARRQRYQTVRAKLANGEIYNINDLITYKVVYDEFYPRHSKHIIDKIDRVLAEHYGFTDEELGFIINYDIKYRMGLEK